MKKTILILTLSITLSGVQSFAQKVTDYSKIDIMLIRGEYDRAIDTCKSILATDSLNSGLYYKIGLAYQNFVPDDKSFDYFLKAATISPDNNQYNFMLAKSYFNRGKMKQAMTLLQKLCASDSMNWNYAYYLTSIYMQEGRFDESLNIYKRFYNKDSTNYVILDKIGFALIKKKEFEPAIELFSKSLDINGKNINAIKNLSYLYASTYRIDTAVQLLTRGIKIDPGDMDLYARRAALNFAVNYTKRALDDYLVILSSGDSSVLYLKRAGIGYSNNLQPKEAVKYLLMAYQKDSGDYEVSSYLGLNFNKLKDYGKSAYYYKHIIKTLNPVMQQLGMTYILLAEELKSDSKYKEAITYYLKGQEIRPDMNINMIIANIYDEKLDDIPKAIYYYQLFLGSVKNSKMTFKPDYVESIRKRFEYLKEKQLSEKK